MPAPAARNETRFADGVQRGARDAAQRVAHEGEGEVDIEVEGELEPAQCVTSGRTRITGASGSARRAGRPNFSVPSSILSKRIAIVSSR